MNKKDFYHALDLLERARTKLSRCGHNDSEMSLKVYFRLMTVGMDITHDKKLDNEGKRRHIYMAEEYGVEAENSALRTLRGDARAQVKLERAFVRGRKAELEVSSGISERDLTDIKAGALRDMRDAMDELNVSNPGKSAKYQSRVKAWQERLSNH